MNIEPDTQEDIDEYNLYLKEDRLDNRIGYYFSKSVLVVILAILMPSLAPMISTTLAIIDVFISIILKILNDFVVLKVDFKPESIEIFSHCILFFILFFIPSSPYTLRIFSGAKNSYMKKDVCVFPAWVGIYFKNSKKVMNHIIFLKKMNFKNDLDTENAIDKLGIELAAKIGRNNFNDCKDYPNFKISNDISLLDKLFLRMYAIAFILICIITPPSITGYHIASFFYDTGWFSISSKFDLYIKIANYCMVYSAITVAILTPYFFMSSLFDRNFFNLTLDSILYDQKVQNVILFRRWFFFLAALCIFPVMGVTLLFMIYDGSTNLLKMLSSFKNTGRNIGSVTVMLLFYLIYGGFFITFTVKFLKDVGVIILSFLGFKFKR